MPSTVWYCCSCTTGPYLISLYGACGTHGCEHHRCPGCELEVIQAQDSDSEAEGSQLRHSNVVCAHVMASKPTCFILESGASATMTTTPPTVLTPSGVSLLTSVFEDTPDYLIPPSTADLASLDTTQTRRTHTPNHTVPSTSHGKGDYVWYCCYCGLGPNNATLDKACPHCNNHWKDSCCRVEKIVVRGQA